MKRNGEKKKKAASSGCIFQRDYTSTRPISSAMVSRLVHPGSATRAGIRHEDDHALTRPMQGRNVGTLFLFLGFEWAISKCPDHTP